MRFNPLLVFFMAVAGLLSSAAKAETPLTILSAQATLYSQSQFDFPCWEAEKSAEKKARNKCALAGFDGYAEKIGAGEVVESGFITGDSEELIDFLEQGYHSFCTAKVVMKCVKVEPPVADPVVDTGDKPSCYVDSYQKKVFFRWVTRWAVFKKTLNQRQLVWSDFKDYANAWHAAKVSQNGLGCVLVSGVPGQN